VLCVGCGTGVLLRLFAERVRGQVPLLGVDPSPAMITEGHAVRDLDARVRLVEGTAEDLPFPDDRFDFVVSSVSFDHWADQSRGLHEAARVTGHLFSDYAARKSEHRSVWGGHPAPRDHGQAGRDGSAALHIG
jgi:ubiquinone/menaquinone biosynthesis C-methylase UbiE